MMSIEFYTHILPMFTCKALMESWTLPLYYCSDAIQFKTCTYMTLKQCLRVILIYFVKLVIFHVHVMSNYKKLQENNIKIISKCLNVLHVCIIYAY